MREDRSYRPRCPNCGTRGKQVAIHGEVVTFWRREDGTWWRDQAHQPGDLCGNCQVPSSRLIWDGVAARKRGR